MSETIASLIAKISADTSGLDAGLGSTKSKLNDMARQLGDLSGNAKYYDQSMMQAMLNGSAAANAQAGAVGNLNAKSQTLMQTLRGVRSSWYNIAWVAAGVTALGAAAKGIYDMGAAGAQLEYTRTRFDRLSESVGETSSVFLSDLRSATKGTMSDAALMKQAGDLMALGLANTSEEAVRLSYVATALNMDMGQLNLTLANESVRRFDQLGVSLTGFKDKLKAIKDMGVEQHEAFKLAFLQQAEEQVLRVGNAADSSLGSYKRLTAGWENYTNALKMSLTDTFVPFNNAASTFLNNQAKQMAADKAYAEFLKSNPPAPLTLATPYGRSVTFQPPGLYPQTAAYQQAAMSYYAAQQNVAAGGGRRGAVGFMAGQVNLGVGGIANVTPADYKSLLDIGTGLTDMTEKYNYQLNQLAEKLIDAPRKYSRKAAEVKGLANNLTGLNDMTVKYNSSLMAELQRLTAAEGAYGKNDARVRELREGINKLQQDASQAADQMLLGTMKNSNANDKQMLDYSRASGMISEQAFQQAVALSKISDAYLNNKITADQAADAAHGVAKGLMSIDGFNAIAYVDVYIRVHGEIPRGAGGGGGYFGEGETKTVVGTTRRALGGPVGAGGIYNVTEYGQPEVLSVGGRQYLLMGSQGGYVTPAKPGGGDQMSMFSILSRIPSAEANARAIARELAKYWG